MNIKRRDFLRYSIASAAALGLPLGVVDKLSKAYAADGAGLPQVIWLEGACCSGCTVSLANLVGSSGPADVADLLFNHIGLAYHPTLMGGAGDQAVQTLKQAAAGDFILVLEGGIPTAFDGHTCILWSENGREVTALEAVRSLAPKAKAILNVGTCSSYGGMAAAAPNPTAIKTVTEITGLPAINIPGCPSHPDWIVSVVAQLLAGSVPALDATGRPTAIFPPGENGTIHEHCPREARDEVDRFGLDGYCLEKLGCKGPRTHSDCYSRKWNNGTEWCIGANMVCVGCTEKGFPDSFSPFYKNSFTSPVSVAVSIGRAEWLAEQSQLIVEGKATAGGEVRVSAVDNGTELGRVRADASGAWRLVVSSPIFVPRQVEAASGGQTAVREVLSTGAGTGTEGGSGTPEPPSQTGMVSINRAEWDPEKRQLRVEGSAGRLKVVKVYDAGSGTLLAMINADSDGRWRLRLRRPSVVPARVRAESEGAAAERAVEIAD